MPFLDIERLKNWFLSEKRDLPWREANLSPYAVWVSEVMLQQTQVAVVKPYFIRWMERFPTVEALAQASLDEVIKMWEGLGYYSRARNLHAGAQYVVQHWGGEIPSKASELQKIKGLGPYTIGAILSFAFHQKVAAVDGNVLRVLARYFNIHGDIAKGATVKKMRELTESLLPQEEPWIVNEALIELGATVCQKKARCSVCPLKTSCAAFAQGTVQQLPVKSKGAKTEYLYRAVAIIRHGNHILLRRGEKGKIMSDLHEFPYIETAQSGLMIEAFQEKLQQQLGLSLEFEKALEAIPQSFTRYQVKLNPIIFRSTNLLVVKGGLMWKSLDEIHQLAFSSGHRRILKQLLDDGLALLV